MLELDVCYIFHFLPISSHFLLPKCILRHHICLIGHGISSFKAWCGDFVHIVSFSENVNNFILDWFQHWNKATFYWSSKVIVIQGDWIVWIDNLGLRLIRPSCWPYYDVLTRNSPLQGSIRIKQIMQNLNFNFYHPPTKLREGNVFTPVCHSVHKGVYDITSCLAALSHVFSEDMMSLPV